MLRGFYFALVAYIIWGFIPTYFKLVEFVGTVELLIHRILWEIIKLKYGVSTDVVEMLKTLEKSRAGEGADASKEATLVADKRTNSVVVKMWEAWAAIPTFDCW